MAEKRKSKKRKEEFAKEEPEKPAKEEYTIAAWLRKNVQTKKTKFLNHNVEYFTAVKAVDALLASHWSEAKEGEEPMFATRSDVVDFMDTMLRHKFFHRAKKVPVSEAELKAKQKKKEGKKKTTEEECKKKEDGESSHAEGAAVPVVAGEKTSKRRKIRLDMHMQQVFVDGLDAYVWIYDPIPVYYWFAGALLVLGAIGICLFPLWPPSVRKGVYYLSVAAAGFLIFIIGLAVLRVVVFCLVWAVTFGAHHFWLFPNLIEDVGFMASFWPIYHYEYKGSGGDEEGKKRKKKDKDSDNEEENRDDDNEDEKEAEEEKREEPLAEQPEQAEASESESESSQKSQTGRDFEMVDKAEVEEEEES